MKQLSFGMRAVVLTTLGIAAQAAFAQQYTGVSRPEQVPVAVSPEGIAQPVVYMPAASVEIFPSATAALPASAPSRVPLGSSVSGETLEQPMVATARIEPAPLPDTRKDNGLRPADGEIITHVPGSADSLPQGTLLKARMLVELSTMYTSVGAPWTAELTAPVERDGRVLIPAGAILSGKVTEVHGGRRLSGQASLHLQTVCVTLPDGLSLGMHAHVIDTDFNRQLKVDDEGTLQHRDHRKEEAGVLALTAGSGAAAGGILGGLPGALVGASVGAGVSTVLWLRQDRQAELPKDTIVTFELSRPLAAISR